MERTFYGEVLSTDILELKKDISIPGKYHRAGEIKPAMLWENIFPGGTSFLDCDNWFINHTRLLEYSKKSAVASNPFKDIIKFVFKSKGLNSISYQEAAYEVIMKLIQDGIVTLKEQQSENISNK